jgi:hypothetical protein
MQAALYLNIQNPKIALAPLNAVKVFLGGDAWFALFAQPMAPPKHSKHITNAPKISLSNKKTKKYIPI